MGGEELEAAGHRACTVRDQREMNPRAQLMFSFHSVQDPGP